MVARMFEAVGVKGKTNHSLCVTGTTRLFNTKIVQERLGHRSRKNIASSCILSSARRLPFTEKENLQKDGNDCNDCNDCKRIVNENMHIYATTIINNRFATSAGKNLICAQH